MPTVTYLVPELSSQGYCSITKHEDETVAKICCLPKREVRARATPCGTESRKSDASGNGGSGLHVHWIAVTAGTC